jgi:hypothetical protein
MTIDIRGILYGRGLKYEGGPDDSPRIHLRLRSRRTGYDAIYDPTERTIRRYNSNKLEKTGSDVLDVLDAAVAGFLTGSQKKFWVGNHSVTIGRL